MKILLVVPGLGSSYGGPSKISPALAAGLARRGHAVDLVTTNADGSQNLVVPINRWTPRDGYRLRYFTRRGHSEYKFSLPLLTWLLRHAGDYDVAHITSSFNFPVLASAVACRLRGTPYVIAPQGMLEPWALGYKADKKRLYLRLVERPYVLRNAHRIQALNGNEAANISALALGPAVAVLPNGIGEEDTAPPDPATAGAFLAEFPQFRGRSLILFMHRIDPKKGLDLLAKAYARIRGQFPDTHLVVAGPATAGFEGKARGYFQTANLDGAVTFTGMLEGVRKQGALAAASVFVAPTRSEGFSMAVLEAMAAGLPCVLTTGNNFPEAATAGAARITAIEEEAFATGLAATLADPAAGVAMGAQARALVLADYTWDSIAAGAERIFGQVVSEPAVAQHR